MRELWEETPCEHGEMRSHGSPEGSLIRGAITCPGGSRRRVRIDYEAACNFDFNQPDPAAFAAVVRQAVDAALVTEEGT